MVYFMRGLIQNSIEVKADVSKTAHRNEEWQIESVIKKHVSHFKYGNEDSLYWTFF